MKPLIASSLANDPDISKAMESILKTVQKYQQEITQIRSANPERTLSYEAALQKLGELRGGKTYFPFLGSGIGNGALVELMDGSIKYDFISGIGVHYFGHNHPDIVAACLQAAISDTVMEGNLQQNIDTVELCNTLVEASGLPHCFLCSSGAMANENALKIAFQHHQPANRILAFTHCFAGRTWSLAQITDKALYREGLPTNVFVDYVPFYNSDSPEESTATAVKVMKEHLARHPKEHAIMFFELVQGEGGCYPGNTDFFRSLMTLCRENNIAVFADEVQTFGRLPQLFAYQYFGLQDLIDIVSIGKLSQVCATLFTDKYLPKAGLLSQTITSSTSAIRSCQVIVQQLLQGGYFGDNGKIAQIGTYFSRKLQEISKRHPSLIEGPYGLGAMVAFTPFEGNPERVGRFVQNLFQVGVIGFTAGSNPMRVRFLVPAGAVSLHDIDVVCDIIEKVLVTTANA
ncbi:MAG: aminotransferase class III-fold pyridoxal phosphate-dependent enzyme [Nitrosomonas sp.]|nr:MAG: aminotransferase class III-fold pyridoxal phosphate-dependent enzyme [Nitrosomonas sp.]